MTVPMRVAVTIEQCWHDVPGGVGDVGARVDPSPAGAPEVTIDLDLVGVAARHPDPPPAPFVPTIPVRHLPLPRLALYESWHRCGWPAVQRATGPVDVIHVTGMAMPPAARPWSSPSTTWRSSTTRASSRARGVRFFHRAIELARRDADLIVCPSEATAEACRRNGFPDRRIRVVPWGDRRPPGAPADIERRPGHATGCPRPSCSGSARSSPARTCRGSSTPSPASGATTSSW